MLSHLISGVIAYVAGAYTWPKLRAQILKWTGKRP